VTLFRTAAATATGTASATGVSGKAAPASSGAKQSPAAFPWSWPWSGKLCPVCATGIDSAAGHGMIARLWTPGAGIQPAGTAVRTASAQTSRINAR
jgi:hypothetical protein